MWRYYARQFGYFCGVLEFRGHVKLCAEMERRFHRWLKYLTIKFNGQIEPVAVRNQLVSVFLSGWKQGSEDARTGYAVGVILPIDN